MDKAPYASLQHVRLMKYGYMQLLGISTVHIVHRRCRQRSDLAVARQEFQDRPSVFRNGLGRWLWFARR